MLGASIFYEILSVGQIKLGRKYPILQKTRLGWVVSGTWISNDNLTTSICNLSITDYDFAQLEKFWKLEECPEMPNCSAEENDCKEYFNKL